ncbi:MAG: DUF5696 domain-containing protein [Candidatus Hydrogenedentales bacterium]|jgi:hypothetical protein
MTAMLTLCMLFSQLTDNLAARVDTLRFHVERLAAITVEDALQTEKEARLTALEEALASEINDEEAFNACYDAIDEVRQWLWQHSKHRPEIAQGSFQEHAEFWRIKNDTLTVTLARDNLALTVNTRGQRWQFQPSDDQDLEFDELSAALSQAKTITAEAFNTGCSIGMAITFSAFEALPDFSLSCVFRIMDSELVMDITAQEPTASLQFVNWPKTIVLDKSPDTLSVIPRMQGMLLPGNWEQTISAADLCNSRSFYMAWWGHLQKSAGVQVILETPIDGGGYYKHRSGGPTLAAPRWYSSLGKLDYQRTIRYVFDDDTSYVKMAKRYRRFMQEKGEFVSLREKLCRTPALDQVIGKPVIHLGALYHFVKEAALYKKDKIENNHNLQTFDQLIERLHSFSDKGVGAAYVHLDGWGFYGYDSGHPDVLPVGEIQGGWEGLRRFADSCAQMNYLFAVHDQYRDFYLNAASYDERLSVLSRNGSRDTHSVWCGGPQSILSARFAPEYVRRNHDLFAANGVNVKGAYLDVFSIVPPEESAEPLYPMTRSECARYRRQCFDLLRARGYVVSSEEPVDFLTPALDLVHHGPYATYPNIGGGDATGIPIPLFNLVYHDSILLPWDMSENGGWGTPTADSGRLHCLLNAGLPYLSGTEDELITQALEAAALAGECAFAEMLNHEFLDDTYRRQRTTYANGTVVTVDFETGDYSITKNK